MKVNNDRKESLNRPLIECPVYYRKDIHTYLLELIDKCTDQEI